MSLDLSFIAKQVRRELRGGLKGFRVFLMCLFLGVAAIASVGTVTQSFVSGMARESQALLGGDLDVSLLHRPASEEERMWLKSKGLVSEVITYDTMGFDPKSGKRMLVEMKGIDALYPLYGVVKLEGDGTLAGGIAELEGQHGALVEDTLLKRLDLEVGDLLRVGTVAFEIRGLIKDEPDRVAGGLRYGPRVLVTNEALKATGLIQTGSLVRYRYRIALPAEANGEEDINQFKAEAETDFPTAGWRIRDRSNSAPGTRFFIDRVSMFLTLVGLAALIVGGVGVGNAVKSYLDRKQEVIATLKCLGAEGQTIFLIYLGQVMALAAVAILAGVTVGAFVPYLLALGLGDRLPIPVALGVFPLAMGQAALFGFLVTLGFATWPLARARQESPAALFRELVGGHQGRIGWGAWTLILGSLVLLGASAIFLSSYPPFSAVFLGGVLAAFVLLIGIARGLTWGLIRLRGKGSALMRMALGNLSRPGAPTTSVVLSMGLGLTLVVTVSLIEGNLNHQINGQIPDEAPSFFFIDIQKDEIDNFTKVVEGVDESVDFVSIPNLRGSILSVKGVPAGEIEVGPDVRWALRGDRGLTYSAEVPKGSKVVEGEWWPTDYAGPPLISMEADIALGLGLVPGDTLTLSVLGRPIEVTVTNFRSLEWETPDFNYVIVFAPGTLEAAPHTYIGNVRVRPEREAELFNVITDAFPGVTTIRVKEALKSINDVLSDLVMGVRVTSMVTVLAGLFVLAGALAAGHRRRLYDAVILKTLGATRGWIARVYVVEFALLGVLTALVAAGLGTLAAWAVVSFAMETDWIFLPARLGFTVVVASAVSVILGLLGTWTTLSAKVAPVLRTV
ncbi:MAG: FtsX-like permease family protein [Alphaproteobacteria bacterium]|nr:MAG: FtsX-like permease family protein [Alphaproteobacteria bacterium]